MATHAIEIERPIEDVFAVATDVTLTGRWYPADVEEWWVTPPPHGVGSVRRARVKVLGRATENYERGWDRGPGTLTRMMEGGEL